MMDLSQFDASAEIDPVSLLLLMPLSWSYSCPISLEPLKPSTLCPIEIENPLLP
jgi:hypothetical protein